MMGKSEPSLVPGWLKNTGSVTGGGSSASRTSRSDATSSNHRSRTSNTICPLHNRLPTYSDRSSSSNSCWVSGTGSGNHAYSSFNKSFRNVNREKRDEDHHFEPLGNIISNRTEKETLRRSHSLVSGKKSEFFPPIMALDSKSNVEGNYNSSNAGHSGSSVKKSVFDEDFPSLRVEEKLVLPELRKVPSLGLNSGWTSALAEVPIVNGGNSMGLSHGQQAVAVSSVSGPAAAGLNMAEALAQAPSRARPHPEIDEATAKTQRLEELAIKQSRQLIPLTPVLPKALVPNSSDKLKPRVPTRTGEASAMAKNGHQLPSMTQHTNHSFRSGQVKSDSPKSSHGKFHVLKPAPKDATSPTSTANSRGSSSLLTFAPFVASTSMKSPNHTEHYSSVKRKSAGSDLKSGLPTEKRLTRAQVKSRNDFFNLIKNQASMNCISTVLPNSDPIISSPTVMKSGEVGDEGISYPGTSVSVVGNMAEVTNSDNDAQRYTSSKEKTFFPDEVVVFPDEEEAAFLRSLGWEENSGEDEGLTEEEISAFYQQYMKVKPSQKGCRGVPVKISMLSESHKAN